jgi:hypothetical protein
LKLKRRGRGDARAPLDEGNGGGGREASGPVWRRLPEACGAAIRAAAFGVSGAGGRRRPGSLTGLPHLSVRGTRRADWAGPGGRRWATAGWKRREEAGPKPFLGLKSNRVKENQF